LIIFIRGLHSKSQGCGASVASAAGTFTLERTLSCRSIGSVSRFWPTETPDNEAANGVTIVDTLHGCWSSERVPNADVRAYFILFFLPSRLIRRATFCDLWNRPSKCCSLSSASSLRMGALTVRVIISHIRLKSSHFLCRHPTLVSLHYKVSLTIEHLLSGLKFYSHVNLILKTVVRFIPQITLHGILEAEVSLRFLHY
jgi:hypothetical protein